MQRSKNKRTVKRLKKKPLKLKKLKLLPLQLLRCHSKHPHLTMYQLLKMEMSKLQKTRNLRISDVARRARRRKSKKQLKKMPKPPLRMLQNLLKTPRSNRRKQPRRLAKTNVRTKTNLRRLRWSTSPKSSQPMRTWLMMRSQSSQSKLPQKRHYPVTLNLVSSSVKSLISKIA